MSHFFHDVQGGMMRIGRFCGAAFLTAMVVCAGLTSAANGAASTRSRPQYGGEPDRVFFLIYVLDIDDISGQEQSFTVNMALRLQWKDERLAHEGTSARAMPLEEVWNPRIILVNQQSPIRMTLPKVVNVEPDGTVNYRQQYLGPLSQELDLRDFPLDTQDFSIHFVAYGYRPDELQFAPMVVPGMEEMVGGGIAKTLSLPDWRMLEYKTEARPYKVSDTFRVPGFALEFVAKRFLNYYIWQVISPLLLIVLISWAPLWVDPTKAELQVGLASSTVITLIAYRFLLSNLVPKLSYMTRMDYLSLGCTVLVFAAFIQACITSVLAPRDLPLSKKVDYYCRVIFPVSFVVLFVWSLLI